MAFAWWKHKRNLVAIDSAAAVAVAAAEEEEEQVLLFVVVDVERLGFPSTFDRATEVSPQAVD